MYTGKTFIVSILLSLNWYTIVSYGFIHSASPTGQRFGRSSSSLPSSTLLKNSHGGEHSCQNNLWTYSKSNREYLKLQQKREERGRKPFLNSFKSYRGSTSYLSAEKRGGLSENENEQEQINERSNKVQILGQSRMSSTESTATRLYSTTSDDNKVLDLVSAESVYKPELGIGKDAQLRKVELKPTVNINSKSMVLSAVNEMNQNKRSCCLIYNDESKLVGIFTERDYLTKIVEAEKLTSETPIVDVMTPVEKLITVSCSTTIDEAMKIMKQNKIRHLPIVQDGKQDGEQATQDGILGVVSTTDLINVIKFDDISVAGRAPMAVLGSFAEIIAKKRDDANTAALAGGSKLQNQDLLRGGFVAAMFGIAGILLQGKWMHGHEALAMGGIFSFGYLGIILENLFEFNKAAVGLLMATALWIVYASTATAAGVPMSTSLEALSGHVGEVSEIIFFLLGAMTIVEIVDSHQGFRVVTDAIKTKTKKGLLWVIGLITFFMSAILDNLTTTIVMVSLLKKLIPDKELRWLVGGLVVIAANAGGAWTPIGDVTTTMLWINGQISATTTIKDLFLPSFISLLFTTAWLTRGMDGEDDAKFQAEMEAANKENSKTALAPRGKLVFGVGLAGLISVPIFKAVTGLPPYLGMLAALGVLWVLTDTIHAGEEEEALKVPAALSKIDVSGILFFFGILLSVGALESAGLLTQVAVFLQNNIPSNTIVATVIGMVSAVIDNVPLVAATMGMYDMNIHPIDSPLWQLIAFCAGTGGSLLVIGSAAGVALMGMEKVDFGWYLKRISASAMVGYLGGIAGYLLLKSPILASVLPTKLLPAFASMFN